MGFWRLIFAIIITVAIIVFILLNFPSAQRLIPYSENLPGLPQIGDLFSSEEKEIEVGDISFVFVLDSYSTEIFSNAKDITIYLEGDVSFMIGSGEVDGEKSFDIDGYTGDVFIKDREIELDGFAEEIELNDIDVLFGENPINGTTNFTRLTVIDLVLDTLYLE
ncbi:hypothetical protein ACFLQN_04045, partial [Candidatus Aenigmatarchaeota archaeon]